MEAIEVEYNGKTRSVDVSDRNIANSQYAIIDGKVWMWTCMEGQGINQIIKFERPKTGEVKVIKGFTKGQLKWIATQTGYINI